MGGGHAAVTALLGYKKNMWMRKKKYVGEKDVKGVLRGKGLPWGWHPCEE
jgi:hypothetical protein